MLRLLPLLLSLSAALHAPAAPPVPAPPVPAPAPTTYQVRGVVQKTDPAAGKALIAHQAIEGYMGAMSMEFRVPDEAVLRKLQPGDQIAFRLCVTEERGWIDQVQVLGREPLPAAAQPSPIQASVRPGDPLPDCALVDSSGKPMRLAGFKGRPLALTFIFSRCPYPEFCPLINRHFQAVHTALLASPGPGNWQLLSISLDPEFDTPERLAAYVQEKQLGGPGWSFATGQPADIERLGRALGLSVARKGAEITHNLRTVLVDAAGRVQRIYSGNEWRPEDLVEDLRSELPKRP